MKHDPKHLASTAGWKVQEALKENKIFTFSSIFM